MDFKARAYSPLLGRFISADTLIPEPGNPQAFNRYSYSLSNPLNYTDPSGHFPVPLIIAAVVIAFMLTADTPGVPPAMVAQNTISDIASTSPTSADALVTMFATDRLAGDTPQARVETILAGTDRGFGAQFAVNFDDSGFRPELQDGSNQVGHFLTAVNFGYNNNTGLGVPAMVGHEMYGDVQGPSGGGGPLEMFYNTVQVGKGLSNPQAQQWFLSGEEANFQNVLDLGWPAGTRNGNSLQDLRLSWLGWRFGQMIRNRDFENNADMAEWLEEQIADPNR
jgi:hypothetical protein